MDESIQADGPTPKPVGTTRRFAAPGTGIWWLLGVLGLTSDALVLVGIIVLLDPDGETATRYFFGWSVVVAVAWLALAGLKESSAWRRYWMLYLQSALFGCALLFVLVLLVLSQFSLTMR